MLQLVVAELRTSLRSWIPSLLALVMGAACAGGVCTAISTGLRTAEAASAGDAAEGIRVLGGMICILTVLAAAGVIGSTSGFVLAAQSREHALWLIVGITPRQLRRTLRWQVLMLAIVAGVLAVPLSYVLARGVLWQWSTIGIAAPGQGPIFEPWQPLVVIALTVVCALWGAWGVTRRASRVSEMTALRQSRADRARVGVLTALVAGAAALGGLTMLGAVIFSSLDGPDDRAAGALSALLVLILATLLVPAWTVRPLLWGWTALVRTRSAAWHLARESSRFSSTRSTATIVPFAIASSLIAVLHGGGAMSGGGSTLAEVGVLTGPTLLVAWTGAICTIVLISRSRSRDHQLLEAAGASPALIRQVACLEGGIYATTALLYGLVYLVAATALLTTVADIPLATAMASIPWGIFFGLAGLTLLTSVGAVLLSTPRAQHAPIT